jgi:hypothetical protein
VAIRFLKLVCTDLVLVVAGVVLHLPSCQIAYQTGVDCLNHMATTACKLSEVLGINHLKSAVLTMVQPLKHVLISVPFMANDSNQTCLSNKYIFKASWLLCAFSGLF